MHEKKYCRCQLNLSPVSLAKARLFALSYSEIIFTMVVRAWNIPFYGSVKV